MNIFEYIETNKDKSFEELKFNNIDNIIFSIITYMPFENVITKKDSINIYQLYRSIYKLGYDKATYTYINELNVLKAISHTKRYKDLIISNFKYNLDHYLEIQFAALTITLPNKTIIIAYRGTDDNIIGWKENFNMTFSETVPIHNESINYINNVKAKFNNKIIVLGHSKGGHLAIYSAMKAKSSIRKKIIQVYNNDGPGFSTSIVSSKEYRRLTPKIRTFIPKNSIIGRIFNSSDNYKVVNTIKKNVIDQHFLYNWKIDGNDFSYQDDIDKYSTKVNSILLSWGSKVNKEDRKELIECIYKTLTDKKIDKIKIDSIAINWIKKTSVAISLYKEIGKEERKLVNKTLKELFISIKEVNKEIKKK